VLQIAEDGNEARYRAQEQLAGHDLPSEAVGRTPGVTGTIALDAGGKVDPAGSKITVDLSKLESDQSRRDNFIRRNTLETETFPQAEFVPREAVGLPNPLPTSGGQKFQLVGDLTVHGVTKPATWDVTAQFAEDGISGQAVTKLKISDFEMTPPKVGPVLSIEDDIALEIDFRTVRQS
jgi:polyisoprenoid-binding protein YceI